MGYTERIGTGHKLAAIPEGNRFGDRDEIDN